ncbi:MAG: IS91 family transposase [Mariprofundales bacterium]
MILLSSIINTFEKRFVAQYGNKLLPSHYKALSAMRICRTEQSPKMRLSCTKCDQSLYLPHSCGDRNCPHCQAHESQQWIDRQCKKQVPANYFLITFTLPSEFRTLVWQHQRTLYSLMIQSAWDTLKTFSQNDRKLRGMPGAIAVLHTHSRRLDFHPHVHVVMPAGAIDRKQRLWRTKQGKKPFLFKDKALAKVFRAKMLEAITQKGLALPPTHPEQWVVYCKSVGSGDKALIYLGRYLYRGVIQEKDIIACKDGKVTFRYQNSKTKQTEYREVSGEAFLWMLMQHVLPKGFRRTRNFGFLHPNSKRMIQVLQLICKIDPNRALKWIKKRPQLTCQCCGGIMGIVAVRIYPPLQHRNALVPT